MNIAFVLSWETVEDAVAYSISEVGSDGVETPLDTTTETTYTVEIDEALDHVFLVRAFDGELYGPPITIVYRKPLTRADLRAMVRYELKDNPPRKWQDEELNQYLREAVDDYSRHFPRQHELTLALSAGKRSYLLPSDALHVSRVEYVSSSGSHMYLKYRPWKGGEQEWNTVGYSRLGIYPTRSARGRQTLGHYDFHLGELTFDFDPDGGDYAVVRYGGYYTNPPFDGVQYDLPAIDAELLVLYACGKALVRIEGQDANLSRWKDEPGRRDDNPITPTANRYFNAYRQKIEERKKKPRFLRRTRV